MPTHKISDPKKLKEQFLSNPLKAKKTLDVIKNYLILSIIDKNKYTSQMKETFGEYIRLLRTENDLTLTQLAAKLNMDSANLSKIENSKREFDEKRLEKLASVFNLDLKTLKDELFSEKFAKIIYQNCCSENALELAEQKVKYLKQSNIKQGNLKF